MREEDRPFSGTEVGALIESFRHEFSILAEKVNVLCADVEDLKSLKGEVKILRDDVTSIKDTLRIAFP